MTIKDFTEPQKLALIDLAMLAMYADAHLGSAEDQRVVRLLTLMGFDTDYDRSKQYDESVTRVSQHSQTIESARGYAASLVQNFTSHEQRRIVQSVLNDIVTIDSHVALQESSFLSLVRDSLER